jgi:hypothetical protein
MKALWVVISVLVCVLVVSAASAEEFKPGLAAHYYKDADNWDGLWPDDTDAPLVDPKTCTFTEFQYTRVEPVVNHLFVRSGWFSVRWVGYIEVPGDGEAKAFLFEVWADDGCRLQIGDTVLINSWYACPEDIPAARRTATATLAPGKHRIVVEYFQGQSLEAADNDPMKLYWASPALNMEKQVVPQERLFHKDEDKETPDAWEIKPPQTAVQLAASMLEDAQAAEENKDYAYALRLYRRILQIAPDSQEAKTARERILAIESDPNITEK